MADSRKLGFGPIAAPGGGVLIVFADDNLRFGPRTRSALGSAADMVARAAKSRALHRQERQRRSISWRRPA